MKRIFSITLIIILLAIGSYFGIREIGQDSDGPLADATDALTTTIDEAVETVSEVVDPTTTTPVATTEPLPSKFQIEDVPFVPQAPHKNWDDVHNETCEEAALLTVHYYLTGRTSTTPDEIETDLQSLITWQNARFGDFEDTTAAQTAEILRDYLGYGERVRIIENATLTDLQREIAAGRPVLVPTAGRLLGNRYFQNPGPIYHMVVATGYTSDEVTTNDPGTQHGENYEYPVNQFWEAVHDFVDRTDEGMARGAKTLIVVD